MQEVIFETKEDADELQKRDYQLYLTQIINPVAKTQTTAWAIPRQRLDGKWTYPILQGADYSDYIIEEHECSNYENEGI